MRRKDPAQKQAKFTTHKWDSRTSLIDRSGAGHHVQFYESDESLVESVGNFIGAGLGAGGSAIVIATRSHRNAIEKRLGEQNFDIESIIGRNRLIFLDAEETLSQLLKEDFPDEQRFQDVVGTLVAKLSSAKGELRAFGEMVALLWAAGKTKAAIQLENLWNNLGKSHTFNLLCAYPLAGFRGSSNSEPFHHICGQHTEVIPAESFAASGHTLGEQNRAIASLQQKAASLEVEVLARRESEEKLLRSTRQLITYLETASIGLHWVGPDGIILWANDADFKALGYSREEYIGHHIAEFHADQAAIEDILGRLNRDEKIRNYEARLRCKNGSIRIVLIDSSVLWDKGEFIHTQCFTRDITELKETEEKLRQAQKMEAVGRLAGGIAHDFNNLLTAINGYSEIALNLAEPDSPLKEFVGEIRKSGERAASLTQQLLGYSRKQIRAPVVLNLNHSVLELGKMLRRLIGEHIEFESNLALDLGAVKADPGQIQQVIMNLVLNARDAMPNGGRLCIETANVNLGDSPTTLIEVPPGPYVMLAVRDNGSGMTEEVKARIFEPFFTTKEVGKGTGLGLPSVYGIIQQNGGSLSVESRLGSGSTFRVYFPTAEPESPMEGVDEVLPSNGTPSKETILLVEDEEFVRKFISWVLANQGFKVLEAKDGMSALCKAQEIDHIDLLLTDVVMPNMTGGQLAERLKSIHPETKVLFMSGYSENDLPMKDISAKSASFLPKPFDRQDLVQKVKEVLDARLPVRLRPSTMTSSPSAVRTRMP